MLALDKKIRPLYEAGVGCRVIGHALDEDPGIIFKRVRRMGIVRSQDVAAVEPKSEIPFQREVSSKNLRKSAIGFVSRWFMERGYMVSVPLETASYDLVAESDEGLKRVQVKTTTSRASNQRWQLNCWRAVYDAKAKQNAGGRRRRQAYTPDDADIIAAVTAVFDLYLIPITQNMPKTMVLDHRWKKFKVGGREGSRTPTPK